ncbi:MAG: hypothetical protein R6U50_15045 [Desulfobacterales bacterium]
MKTYGLLIFIIFCICISAQAQDTNRSYQVGEKWVYQYEGPKTHRFEALWEMDFYKGERKREVLFFKEKGGKTFCVIQENYGKPDPVKTHYYVDENNFIAVEVSMAPQHVVTSVFKPGCPFDIPDLEIGEEKVFEYTKTNDLLHNTTAYNLTIERLEDQTIEVPAGTFENCKRFKMSVSAIIEPNVQDIRKTVINLDTDLWWHPSVNGTVKEVSKTGPFEYVGEMLPGYVAKSVLTSYSSGK